MSTTFSAKGSCLCGAVSFEANTASNDVGVCHCSMCRTWSGGPYVGVDCGTDLSITGEITIFNSSDWAERAFCPACGTHLYYKFKANGQTIMPAGLFDDKEKLVMDHQIFIDEKPDYYDFANQTKNMTAAEVMAMFADVSESEHTPS